MTDEGSPDWDDIDDPTVQNIVDVVEDLSPEEMTGNLDPKNNPKLYRGLLNAIKQGGHLSNRAIVGILEDQGHKTNAGAVSLVLNGKRNMPKAWAPALARTYRQVLS